jgi:hypothetical protein
VVTGESQEQTAKSTARIADKPMMVLVTDPDPTNKDMRKLEDVVFKNESLAIGTKFFDAIRINEADAARDRILAEAGKGAPRIVFLRRDFSVSGVVSKHSLKPRKITGEMRKVVKKTYVNSFDKMVKGYIKLLTRLDGLDSVRRRLADKRSRLNGSTDKSKLKKLDRDVKKYDKDMEKWTADEEKLLTFKSKAAKAPKA